MDPSIYDPEPVYKRASQINLLAHARTVFLLLVAVMLFVVIVLLGVMVGRKDASVSHAVQHVFSRIDGEQMPSVPRSYASGEEPTLVVIVGDSWAAGLGVADTSQDAWWQHLNMLTVRSTNTTARLADLPVLLQRVRLPSALQSQRVALVVQCGWNDLAETGRLPDMRRASAAIAGWLSAAVGKAAWSGVYWLDYPDVSAGTGYTEVQCAAPLDNVYNRPATARPWIDLLDMFSEAVQTRAVSQGWAWVPLRRTLQHVGGAQDTSAVAHERHRPVDVHGRHVGSPLPPAFDRHCDAMNVQGQRYQGDLVAAFLRNQEYFVVG